VADRVQVMYAGRVAEIGGADDMFHRARHPYTHGLLESLPATNVRSERLKPIIGSPPSMLFPPSGCAFHPRCPSAQAKCSTEQPPLAPLGAPGQECACYFPIPVPVANA
jgi:oligopeptide/dipeptide ABC transporter ATP-binding protein